MYGGAYSQRSLESFLHIQSNQSTAGNGTYLGNTVHSVRTSTPQYNLFSLEDPRAFSSWVFSIPSFVKALTFRRSRPLAFILLMSICVAGCSDPLQGPVGNYDEEKMEQAIKEARATLDHFLERFRNPKPGDEFFGVKVKIEDENGVEHFWLADLKLATEPYSGVIDNEPGIVKNVKYGQTYSFTKDDISDWEYMSNGVMHGNYTLKVLLDSMSKRDADEIRKKLGW